MTDDERRIVEWLREWEVVFKNSMSAQRIGSPEEAREFGKYVALRSAADAIERGDHRK